MLLRVATPRNYRACPRALAASFDARWYSAGSAGEEYAVAPYRRIDGASVAQRAAWAVTDTKLHNAMREHVPAALAHNGEEAFDDHLVAVQSVLRAWGAPERLTHAALFHSIYGTEGFQGFKLHLSQRPQIVDLIGPEAERLAWIFCMVDRSTVDATVLAPPPGTCAAAAGLPPPSFFARPELGGFEIALRSEREWLEFLTLSLADWLEQVEGAAMRAVPSCHWPVGQAWAYRRDGYAAIARLLSERAEGPLAEAPCGAFPARMHAEVFAREP